MTTTETHIEMRTCPTCHGKGEIPAPVTNPRQRKLLEQLTEAGSRRAAHSAKRGLEHVIAKNKAYDDIRKLAERAETAGLTRNQVAEAVGVTRAALHNILTGKAGG